MSDYKHTLYPIHPEFKGNVSYSTTNSPQNILLDVMKPTSPYTTVLLSLQVGQGKTYGAAALAHMYLDAGYYVLYASHTVITTKNFIKEYEIFIEDQRTTNNYKNYIDCFTLTKLHHLITGKRMTKRYGLVILDEAHNLRDGKSRFMLIKNEIHKWSNIKVLLITATPMIDDVSELDTLRTFIPYFKNEKCHIIYTNNVAANVNKTYRGIDTEFGKLYISVMRGKQYHNYLTVNKTNSNNISGKLRTASICCDKPEFTIDNIADMSSKFDAVIKSLVPGELTSIFSFYKDKGVYALADALDATGKYIRYVPTSTKTRRANKKGRIEGGINNVTPIDIELLANEMDDSDDDVSNEEMQETEYGDRVRNIDIDKVCTYINNLSVETISKPKYAIITGNTPAYEVDEILEEFTTQSITDINEGIQVLIGSIVLSESISFRELKHIHILHPFWNYGAIHQAIGRATRINSHKERTDLNIYLHASVAPHESELNLSDAEIIERVENKTFKGVSSDIDTWRLAWSKQKRIFNKLTTIPTINAESDEYSQFNTNENSTEITNRVNTDINTTAFDIPVPNNTTVFLDKEEGVIYDFRKCIDTTPSKTAWGKFKSENTIRYNLNTGTITHAIVPNNLFVYTPIDGYSIWVSAADGKERISFKANNRDKRLNKRGRIITNMNKNDIATIASDLNVDSNISSIVEHLKKNNRYFKQIDLL